MKALLLSSTLAAAFAAAPALSETLRVGVATAQTGALAYADVPVSGGMRLAADEINAKGGIAATSRSNLSKRMCGPMRRKLRLRPKSWRMTVSP